LAVIPCLTRNPVPKSYLDSRFRGNDNTTLMNYPAAELRSIKAKKSKEVLPRCRASRNSLIKGTVKVELQIDNNKYPNSVL
jgi:hypothetical protein